MEIFHQSFLTIKVEGGFYLTCNSGEWYIIEVKLPVFVTERRSCFISHIKILTNCV